jgi:outer membrane protein
MTPRAAAVLAAGAMLLAADAHALDLVQAWRAAQEHDLDYTAARAAHDAGLARRAQGSALWRPSVALTGTAGRMSSNTATTGAQFTAPGFGTSNGVSFDTSIKDGTTESWGVTARQPLVSGERLAQGRQLALAADVAEQQWAEARQSLLLRTAERYFDVVLAAESLRVLREQQAAIEEARAQAQERFRVGDSPITDTHEAAARAEGVRAQVLAAETDLQLKQIALSDVTGVAPQDLALDIPAGVAASDVGGLDHWLEEAARNNPTLRMQAAGVEVAREEVARTRATSSPSLDLVARFGRDRLYGSGDFGAASNVSSSGMIGVQVTVPVFTGGYRSAQHEEALGLAEKARAEEGRGRQQIALQTRAAWLGLTVGAGRVAALSAALDASRARLDATRLGRQVGDRSTLDLLNAQSDAAGAELNLLQARIGLVTERLRLAALSGSLDEDQLKAVSAGIRSGSRRENP